MQAMADREKLVELIRSAKAEMKGKDFSGNLEREYFMAEHLIAHGVTVKQMQKPLMLEELHDIKAEAFLEIEGCYPIFHVSMPEFDGLESTKFRDATAIYGDEHGFICDNRRYGELWRCWANRPTEEERKAAAWL